MFRSSDPSCASDQTGAIDMTALMARLDELDRKAKRPAPRGRRPISWQAALVLIVVVLAIAALVGFLAAVHVIPAA